MLLFFFDFFKNKCYNIIIDNKKKGNDIMTPEQIFEIIKNKWSTKYDLLTESTVEDIIKPEQNFSDYDYRYGATKFVLIAPKEDFVIKIPFCGEYYDEEFSEFCGGWDGNWDYCKTEEELYKIAAEKGIEQCFARTFSIGEVGGYTIYAQEKARIWSEVHSTNDYEKEKTESIKEKCNENHKYYYCFHACWLSDFLDYYGNTVFEKFMDFVEAYSIEDLHSSNLGYINGRPVVVDYSGFYD